MKHPGTAGLMPVKGTTCGLRPDLDEMGKDTGFDFSMAEELLTAEEGNELTDKQDVKANELQPVKDSEAEC